MKIIGFHNSDEEYGFLSNWYPTVFYIRGQRFTSMEQYMMYRKAKLFQDLSAANLILQTNDVAEIKNWDGRFMGMMTYIGTEFASLLCTKDYWKSSLKTQI